MALAESRVETIEGTPTLVVERRPPLQPTLDRMLAALTRVQYHPDPALRGMSAACTRRDHPFAPFREGRHVGLDGIVRDVELRMCIDCGAVRVMDVSYDRLPGLPVGRGGPRRKSDLLGWYSGARRQGREYR